MAKAVLVTPPYHDLDLSSLEAYGETVFIWPDGDPARPCMYDIYTYLGELRAWFEANFDPEHDYFVFAGPSTAVAYGFATVRALFGDYVQVLLWDPRRQLYTEVNYV